MAWQGQLEESAVLLHNLTNAQQAVSDQLHRLEDERADMRRAMQALAVRMAASEPRLSVSLLMRPDACQSGPSQAHVSGPLAPTLAMHMHRRA